MKIIKSKDFEEIFNDVEVCKELITEALGCEVIKSPEGWSWYHDRILLVQEHTPLCDKLINIIQNYQAGQWLYNRILTIVMYDLAKRQQFLLDTVNSFADHVEEEVGKVSDAEWRISFFGGEIDEE